MSLIYVEILPKILLQKKRGWGWYRRGGSDEGNQNILPGNFLCLDLYEYNYVDPYPNTTAENHPTVIWPNLWWVLRTCNNFRQSLVPTYCSNSNSYHCYRHFCICIYGLFRQSHTNWQWKNLQTDVPARSIDRQVSSWTQKPKTRKQGD